MLSYVGKTGISNALLNDTFLYLNVVFFSEFITLYLPIYFYVKGGSFAKLGLIKAVFCLSAMDVGY
jgi:hypothetical protein